MWALGNIAGDGPMLRDFVIKSGVVEPLLTLARSGITIPFLRNVTWTISNLCRNKNPSPPIEVVRMCMPTLLELTQHTDTEILGKRQTFVHSLARCMVVAILFMDDPLD